VQLTAATATHSVFRWTLCFGRRPHIIIIIIIIRPIIIINWLYVKDVLVDDGTLKHNFEANVDQLLFNERSSHAMSRFCATLQRHV